MVESQAPDGAAIRIIPPALPAAAILIGAGLDARFPIDIVLQVSSPLRYWVGGAVIAGGFLLLIAWPVLLFRRSGQHEAPWTPTPSIIERGPYRFTRNPMYLQMVLGCIGFAILLNNDWILLFTPVVFWALQILVIRYEEEYLERKFGGPYLEYKRRVRRWI